MIWVLAVTALLLGCCAIVLAALYVWRERKYRLVKAQRDRLNIRCAELSNKNINLKAELARYEADNEEFVNTIGELSLEIERLKKSADHATIPLQEAAPVPKRPRKKASTA